MTIEDLTRLVAELLFAASALSGYRWLAHEQGAPLQAPPAVGTVPWLVTRQDEPESGNAGLGG